MFAKATQPYICPVCCAEPENYYGRLVFPVDLPPTAEQYDAVAENGGSLNIPDPPTCPNHRAEDGTPILVALIPVVR